MAFLSLATGIWVVANAFTSYSGSSEVIKSVDNLTFSLAPFMVTALFNLALLYPYPLIRLDKLHYVLMYIPSVMFAAILVKDQPSIAQSVFNPNVSGKWSGGPLYPFYTFFILIVFLISIVVFWLQYKKADGIHRRNTLGVMLSLFLGSLPSIYLDVIVPIFTNGGSYPLIGPISTIIWLGTTSYIVMRK